MRIYHSNHLLLVSACFIFTFLTLLSCGTGSEKNKPEWQKKYHYAQVREQFADPPLWYAPHAFWFWDAPLDPRQTASMAKEMTRQRLNPGYAHPRHSEAPIGTFPALPPEEWLSDLWFESFGAALDEAGKEGMTLGYCDEYWWPSGRANGRVLKQEPDLATKSLEWEKEIINGPERVQITDARFAVAGQLDGQGKVMANTLRVVAEQANMSWNVPDGKWVLYKYKIVRPTLDKTAVNYLDDRLMDVFIPIAHESYEKHLGQYMGNLIPGVFVDNEGDFGRKMAWSAHLATKYQEMKGRDIRIWLPLLTEKDSAGLWAKARYDWFDVVSEIYTNNFLGSVNDWLKERGMYYISNLWEESLLLQTRAVGDFMRAQRRITLPGNDCLEMFSQNVHDFKETQSVCEFEDRPFMTELMGVAGWEQTPVQMKMTINAVTAWGVSHTVPHGIYLNRKLETIPYPADWFTENPYWRYLHLWTDFARRASFVNRQGRLVADVLLYNPLESIWALSEGYFTSPDGDQWPEKAEEINRVYSMAMDKLTKSRTDYLIADAHYMKEAKVKRSGDGAELQIGEHTFKALVLPPLYIIPEKIMQKIIDFARAGGMVILLGELPAGSTEKGMMDVQIDEMNKMLRSQPSVVDLSAGEDKMAGLSWEINKKISPQVQVLSGSLPLIVSHKKLDGNDFYWLANNTENGMTMGLSFREGSGRAEKWDCETGTMRPLSYEKKNDRNLMEIEIKPYEAFWIVFDAGQEPLVATDRKRGSHEKKVILKGTWQITYPETNTIPLTSASALPVTDTLVHREYTRVDFDDSSWQSLNIVGPVRMHDTWHAAMFYNPDPESKNFYRYRIHLDSEPVAAVININGDNAIRFWVNGQPVKLGLHAHTWIDADIHDITKMLHKGENVLAIEETNHKGYGWLIMQGMVYLQDGTAKNLDTDKSWKMSAEEVTGWEMPGFDDSLWNAPQFADKNVSESIITRLKKPQKIVMSQGAVWWRIPVVPASKAVVLPGLSARALCWLDGQLAERKGDTLMLPADAHLLTVRNLAGDDGLSSPGSFLCTGYAEKPLGSWLAMGLRRFSGFMDYTTTFEVPEGTSSVRIDLGKVLHMAEVWVDGRHAGERLWPPYEFDMENLSAGKHKLRVRVGNLYINAMGAKEDLGLLRHWGWHGAPPEGAFEAGLFGPVTVKAIKGE